MSRKMPRRPIMPATRLLTATWAVRSAECPVTGSARPSREKAEASTTPGAGSSGAQGGGLTITTDVVNITTGSAGASYEVPADHKKVERKQH